MPTEIRSMYCVVYWQRVRETHYNVELMRCCLPARETEGGDREGGGRADRQMHSQLVARCTHASATPFAATLWRIFSICIAAVASGKWQVAGSRQQAVSHKLRQLADHFGHKHLRNGFFHILLAAANTQSKLITSCRCCCRCCCTLENSLADE